MAEAWRSKPFPQTVACQICTLELTIPSAEVIPFLSCEACGATPCARLCGRWFASEQGAAKHTLSCGRMAARKPKPPASPPTRAARRTAPQSAQSLRARACAVAAGDELRREPVEVSGRLDRAAAGAAEVAVVQERDYSIRGAAVGEACREAAVAGAEDHDAGTRLVQVQRCCDSRPAFSIVVLGPPFLANVGAHGCDRGLPGV